MFRPAVYETKAARHRDAEAALDLARTTLIALGFAIHRDSGHELRAEGPGMHHSSQPGLLGVSMLRLRASGSTVSATATLGGVRFLKAFVYLFPPGLSLALLVTFNLSGMDVPWISVVWVTPWVVIAPLLGRLIERRTTRAVDTLVRSMASTRPPA